MRVFLLVVFCLFVVPAYAQQVRSFTTSEGNESAGGTTETGWEARITDRDDNMIRMMDDREYTLASGTLSETINIDESGEITNVYDFESKVIYHRFENSNRSLTLSKFSDFDGAHMSSVQKYACYIARNSRQKELIDFKERHCKGQK